MMIPASTMTRGGHISKENKMIRLLGLLVAVLIVVAGIGYYRGWFQAESHDNSGQHTVILTVDKDKLNQDKASVQQKVHDLEHK